MGSLGPPAESSYQDRIDPAVTQAAIEHTRKEGWGIIPNVLTAEESKYALDRLWEAAKKYKEQAGSNYIQYLDPNENNVRVADLPMHDRLFCDMAEHPLAVKIVQDIIGDNYLISNFSSNIARPGSKSMALHSDLSLVTPEPWQNDWALNVIWCLTDVTYENGATLYIPGSQAYQRMSDIPKNAKSLLTPFQAKAGSIVLMTGRVWHTSGSNITKDQDRALVLAYYTAPFLKPQMNWSLRIPQEKAKDFPPSLIKRLGMVKDGGDIYNIDALKYLDEQYPDEEVPSNTV